MKYCLFVAIYVLSSCQANEIFLRDLNESLIKASADFKKNAQYQTLDFEEKGRDPITAIKVKEYLPAVRAINNETKEIESILDSMIANKYSISKDKANLLFRKIGEYKFRVFKADERVEKLFKNDFVILGKQADSLIRNEADLYKTLTTKENLIEREVFLNTIKSNIWYNTSHVLYFLRTTFTYHIPHYYPGPVLGCNTTVVQSGDSIKLFAGIGHFDWNTPYSIALDGKTLTKAEKGMIEYDFVPKGKPGKYKLPVTFRYINQDGKEMIFDTKIEYKIVN
ncbi:hypothetical protein PDL71_13505 [Lacibacter sp. MH-610]|uniref:hypothetical protein n=1 Tax=Lacibacter sp. MH-610 TaxID=3020883 RepID=UPI003891303D